MTIRHVSFVAVSNDDRTRKGTERKTVSGLNWPHLLRVSKAQKELKRKERKEKGTVKEKKKTERGKNMSWKSTGKGT